MDNKKHIKTSNKQPKRTKLTIQERTYINEYLKHGNKQKAYRIAYNKENDGKMYTDVYKVHNKPIVNKEIQKNIEKAETEAIATATEIMTYFTEVMRGNVLDQFGLEAPLSERTKAAQELAKRVIDMQQNATEKDINISLDFKGIELD